MLEVTLHYEPYIRLGAFGSVFLAMAIWEVAGPRRQQTIARHVRWPTNFGIVVLDALLVRLIFPPTAVGFALVGDAREWGLFHLAALPTWMAAVVSVVLLALPIYFKHVRFHA